MSTDSSPASLNAGRAPVVMIEPTTPSLDVQIIQAENAVLQRDRQVRDALLTVGARARDAGSRVGVVLAVTAGTAVVGWLLLRNRAAPATVAAVAPQVKRRASLALVRAAAFVWPLLPLSVKSRASSAMVGSVLRGAGPLLARSGKARQPGDWPARER